MTHIYAALKTEIARLKAENAHLREAVRERGRQFVEAKKRLAPLLRELKVLRGPLPIVARTVELEEKK